MIVNFVPGGIPKQIGHFRCAFHRSFPIFKFKWNTWNELYIKLILDNRSISFVSNLLSGSNPFFGWEWPLSKSAFGRCNGSSFYIMEKNGARTKWSSKTQYWMLDWTWDPQLNNQKAASTKADPSVPQNAVCSKRYHIIMITIGDQTSKLGKGCSKINWN